jgi:uncharacterized phage protein (TIGR01671 family)
MREIKFRIFDKNAKLMIGQRKNDWFSIRNDGFVAWQNNKDNSPENVILMQFTGLKDKNGKEIYEGDILAYKFNWGNGEQMNKHEVRWDEERGCWILPSPMRFFEVVYENPELLEVQQ